MAQCRNLYCTYCGKDLHSSSTNIRRVLASHYKACRCFQNNHQRTTFVTVDYEYNHEEQHMDSDDGYDQYMYEQHSDDNSSVASDSTNDTLIVRENDRLYLRFDNTLNAIPSHDLLLFQLAISAKYSVSTSAPFTVRSSSGSWQDFVRIHDFVKSHNLSTAAGDDLIVLIKAICNNQSYPINLPKNMRTILDAIKKCVGDIYLYETVMFKYPSFLIDPQDFPDSDNIGFLGTFLNPLQIVSEYLLQLDLGDIVFEPYQDVSEELIRYS